MSVKLSAFEFKNERNDFFYKSNTVAATLGNYSYIAQAELSYDYEKANVIIGKFCSISSGIRFIVGRNHNYKNLSTYPYDFHKFVEQLPEGAPPPPITHHQSEKFNLNRYQVLIGNDVWIGENVTILGGIKIGNGAVVGAGAVVSKDVPAYSIVAGNPARVIKYRFDSETIRKLQAIKWWDWTLEKIQSSFNLMGEPEKFADEFYSETLETKSQDRLAPALRDFKFKGFRIFSAVVDYDSNLPLWKFILDRFAKCDLHNVLLVFHVPNRFSFKTVANDITANWNPCDDKFIFAIPARDEVTFSTESLRETNILITTRHFDSLLAWDALNDQNADIRYALDDIVFF